MALEEKPLIGIDKTKGKKYRLFVRFNKGVVAARYFDSREEAEEELEELYITLAKNNNVRGFLVYWAERLFIERM